MRPFLILIALLLGSAASAHNAAPGIGLDLVLDRFDTSLGTSHATAPACVTQVFAANEAPENPTQIDSITCLNASCTTREIVLCAHSD